MAAAQSFFERWLAGFAQLFGGELRGLALVAALFTLFTVAELLWPAERGQRWAGRLRNLVYMAVYLGLGMATLSLWYTFGPTRAGARSPQANLPIESLLLLPAYMFAGDFVYYWYHRAQHRYPALWAIHELHHSDAELNVTTSYRTFWLEAPVQAIVVGAPVVWLFGRPGAQFALVAMVVSRFVLLFAHSNLRLPLGPLTLAVCGPQWHRVHHSRLPEHRDANYAQLFPVLDWLFGTFYAPARDEYPPTGTENLASDASIWRAQMRPVAIWRRQLAALAQGRRAT